MFRLNDDYEEYIESQLEAERNATYDENEEEIYSDDVQNAFVNYEDEVRTQYWFIRINILCFLSLKFSKYWTQQESVIINRSF